MITKKTLYIKTFFAIILFLITAAYMISYVSLELINVKLYQSLIKFLNDMNPQSNILEYIAILIIKLIYNVDIHHLKSFFDNINPII